MNATILLTLALAAPPADLAIVPQDAIAVVHIRGKDLWKSDLMIGLRTTLEKAGPKAIAAFDGGFYPTPSTISGFTGFILAPDEGQPIGPKFVGIIAFDTAFDVAKVRATYCDGESKAFPGKSIYPIKNEQMCLYFPDDKHIVFSLEERLFTMLTRKPGKANQAIAAAIERVAAGSTVVAAVDLEIGRASCRERV